MNWTRVVMDKTTNQLVKSLDYQSMTALEVSGAKWQNTGFRSYRSLAFPDFDICGVPLAHNEKYDIVIAEQVFEHLLWPYRAVRNVLGLLNPSGHFLITTPFLLPVHDYPVDCSRWTELGLKHLLAEGGFDLANIETGSWGNKACVRANLDTWRPYNRWFHSLKNSPRHPVVVWALAKK